jgi:prolipoprotein diacylglyceryl transferase
MTSSIYCKARKLNFLEWTDYIAPGLLIGQAIGRWGNFVNQEVYGGPSNLPWAITIDPPYRLPGFEQVARYHPLFLYESLLNFLAAGLLVLINRNGARNSLLAIYSCFILYSTQPFVSFWSSCAWTLHQSTVSTSIRHPLLVLLIIAILLLVLRHTVWAEKLAAKEEILTRNWLLRLRLASWAHLRRRL